MKCRRSLRRSCTCSATDGAANTASAGPLRSMWNGSRQGPKIAGAGVARRAHADEARQIGLGIAEILGDHGLGDLEEVRHAFGQLVAGVYGIDAVGMVRRLRAYAANDRRACRFAGPSAADITQTWMPLTLVRMGETVRRWAGPASCRRYRSGWRPPFIHRRMQRLFCRRGFWAMECELNSSTPVGDGEAAGGCREPRFEEACGRLWCLLFTFCRKHSSPPPICVRSTKWTNLAISERRSPQPESNGFKLLPP